MLKLSKKTAIDVLGNKAELTGTKYDRRAFAPFEAHRVVWSEEKKSQIEETYLEQARIVPQKEDPPGDAQVFTIKSGWQRAWASACTHACTDTTRPHITCVYYDGDEDRLVGTDGHRLSMSPFSPRDQKGDRPKGMMLPLIHVHHLGSFHDQLAFWIEEDGRARFQVGGAVVSAPTYRGLYTFPTYRWLVPKKSDVYAAHVDGSRWADVVRMCPTTTGAVHFRPVTYSRAALVAEAETPNDDRSIEPWKTSLIMPGDFTWREGTDLSGYVKRDEPGIQPWAWGSNASYLADGIDAVSPDVRIMLPADPLDPFHIGRAKDDWIDLDGPITIVMPCRT